MSAHATPQVLVHNTDSPEPSPAFRAREASGEITAAQGAAYREFLARVVKTFLLHPIVTHNRYTTWFASGSANDDQLRHFAVQFSVFSNQFLIAQLQKVINADNLQAMRSAKEILANELGVIFNDRKHQRRKSDHPGRDVEREGDPDLVSTEGTIEGGVFRFRAAHFEWLVNFGEDLGLGFNDLGKRQHGTKETLFYCDELIRLYGSEQANVARGASFAIENWAASGFWQQLEDGLYHIKRTRRPNLAVAFFTWHNRVEAQHAGHTIAELEEAFFAPDFDAEVFLTSGREMLDGLAVFWNGLADQKR